MVLRIYVEPCVELRCKVIVSFLLSVTQLVSYKCSGFYFVDESVLMTHCAYAWGPVSAKGPWTRFSSPSEFSKRLIVIQSAKVFP